MRAIRRIEQKHENGCAPACLAMVLGLSYDEVADQFLADFNRHGIPFPRVRDFLVDHGLNVIEKKSYHSADRKKHNKRMLEPFANVHIVLFQPQADSTSNHVVVMTRNGKILDPSPLNIQDTSLYYYVISVLGCFWD